VGRATTVVAAKRRSFGTLGNFISAGDECGA
jgi:hypothetical protein